MAQRLQETRNAHSDREPARSQLLKQSCRQSISREEDRGTPMVTFRLRTFIQDQSGSNQLVCPREYHTMRVHPGWVPLPSSNNSPSPTFIAPEKISYWSLDHHILKNIPTIETLLSYGDPLSKWGMISGEIPSVPVNCCSPMEVQVNVV